MKVMRGSQLNEYYRFLCVPCCSSYGRGF